MTHVVTDSCISCKYTDCVIVCPVDCFHEGPNFLVIDPEACIDCALCVAECPVNAIFAEGDLRDEDKIFTELNNSLSLKWPVIRIKKEELPSADDMATVKNKFNSGLLKED